MDYPQNHYVAQINEKTGKPVYTKYDLERKAGNWFIFSRLLRNGKKETLKVNGRYAICCTKKEALLRLMYRYRHYFAMNFFSQKEKIPITEFCDRAKWLSICADAAKKMGLKEIS